MRRFGGWEAQWLASVIMMTATGRQIDNGMEYVKYIAVPAAFAKESDEWSTPKGRFHKNALARIYVVGLVDIDEVWLKAIVPDSTKYEALLEGRKDEFFAE